MHVRILMAAAALAITGTAAAQQASTFTQTTAKIGSIEVARAWVRATPKGANVAAGYLVLTNTGTVSDRLIGGGSEACGRVEVHAMATADGVMRMRPVNGLEIRPGRSVVLAPASYHLMCLDLKRQLVPGETLEGTLQFEQAGRGVVAFSVQPIGRQGPGGEHGHAR